MPDFEDVKARRDSRKALRKARKAVARERANEHCEATRQLQGFYLKQADAVLRGMRRPRDKEAVGDCRERRRTVLTPFAKRRRRRRTLLP